MPSLALMSTPTVGLSRISRRGLRGEPLGQHDPLLVAARERLDRRCPGSATLIARSPIQSPPSPAPAAAVDQARAAGEPVQHGHDEVDGDRLLEDQAERQPVLGHVGDAVARSPRGWSAAASGLPSSRISPRSGGFMPNSDSASSVRPAPSRPVRPRISPSRTARLTSSYSPRARQVADLEHGRRGPRSGSRWSRSGTPCRSSAEPSRRSVNLGRRRRCPTLRRRAAR